MRSSQPSSGTRASAGLRRRLRHRRSPGFALGVPGTARRGQHVSIARRGTIADGRRGSGISPSRRCWTRATFSSTDWSSCTCRGTRRATSLPGSLRRGGSSPATSSCRESRPRRRSRVTSAPRRTSGGCEAFPCSWPGCTGWRRCGPRAVSPGMASRSRTSGPSSPRTWSRPSSDSSGHGPFCVSGGRLPCMGWPKRCTREPCAAASGSSSRRCRACSTCSKNAARRSPCPVHPGSIRQPTRARRGWARRRSPKASR